MGSADVTAPIQEGLAVLIVDDHRDSAESLALLLRCFGHRASVESQGMLAVETARSQQPDVVILELRLRDLDGCEVARRLRAAGCGARLIAYTTCGRPEDRRRSSASGIEWHFLKPADSLALAAAIVEMNRAADGKP